MKPTQRLLTAFQLLLQGQEYTQELGCDPWDFAVEISCLRELGLTNNDLRWLLYKNYAVQGLEVIDDKHDRRVFHSGGLLHLANESCFILTEEGEAFARSLADNGIMRAQPSNGHAVDSGSEIAISLPSRVLTVSAKTPRNDVPGPCWDKDRRSLFFGTTLVKQFKVPAPNQEIILEAMQEENWPARIDDPLPAHPAIDPKRRLHDTINSLNRNQRVDLLRFMGDGSGQAICWEAIARGY